MRSRSRTTPRLQSNILSICLSLNFHLLYVSIGNFDIDKYTYLDYHTNKLVKSLQDIRACVTVRVSMFFFFSIRSLCDGSWLPGIQSKALSL